jgi:hypothetical protein
LQTCNENEEHRNRRREEGGGNDGTKLPKGMTKGASQVTYHV